MEYTLGFITMEYTPWLPDQTQNLYYMQSVIFDHDTVATGAILILFFVDFQCCMCCEVIYLYYIRTEIINFLPFPPKKIIHGFWTEIVEDPGSRPSLHMSRAQGKHHIQKKFVNVAQTRNSIFKIYQNAVEQMIKNKLLN